MTKSEDSVKTLSLGEILRAKREEMKIEISEVSSHLRVKASDIEAIEHNRLRRITNRIYTPGFIRTYAKFLRIDNRIIEEQLSLLSFGSNVENRAHVLINLEEDDDLSPSKTTYLNILAIAVLLVLIAFPIYNFCEDKSDLITSESLISQLNSVFGNER